MEKVSSCGMVFRLLFTRDFMQNCEHCGNTGDISLREATIKDQGRKWICGDCWTTLFDKNEMVSGSSCGGACGFGCASCRHG